MVNFYVKTLELAYASYNVEPFIMACKDKTYNSGCITPSDHKCSLSILLYAIMLFNHLGSSYWI